MRLTICLFDVAVIYVALNVLQLHAVLGLDIGLPNTS